MPFPVVRITSVSNSVWLHLVHSHLLFGMMSSISFCIRTGRLMWRFALLFLLAYPTLAQEVIVYGGSGKGRGADSFLERANHIDVISPQVYAVDSLGNVRGGVPERLLNEAKQTGTHLMPLIMNPGFNQEIMHGLLNNFDAQRKVVDFMVEEGQNFGYWGWQFDFENIDHTYKDRFTDFFRMAASALHEAGMTASVAVVPTNDQSEDSGFSRYMQENWRGNFDMAAIAEAGDFISLMTYAVHGGPTAPGPIAGLPWVREMLQYALDQGVPAEKISLGLPFYSGYWYPDCFGDGSVKVRGREVSYALADSVLTAGGADRTWLPEQGVTYGFWQHFGVFRWVFLEDARSMTERLKLFDEFPGLRGASIWVLGTEDPAVWPLLDARFHEGDR